MGVSAIILAGGKSSRMGKDKGLIPINGKAMVELAIHVLKPFAEEIIIISNNKEYNKFGYPVYEDLIKDSGPLAGIYTGLSYSKNEKNIVLSCDVPYVGKDLINLLLSNCENNDVVIPEKDGDTHQLIGVYSKSCMPLFKQELGLQQRKIITAINKLNLKIINANQIDNKQFTNINTIDDFKA